MLVFYSGRGLWTAKTKSKTRYAINNKTKLSFEVSVAGYFVLTERKSILNLRHQRTADALKLYPCYTHVDGAVFESFGKESEVYFEPFFIKNVSGTQVMSPGASIMPSDVINENYQENELLPVATKKITVSGKYEIKNQAFKKWIDEHNPDTENMKKGQIQEELMIIDSSLWASGFDGWWRQQNFITGKKGRKKQLNK